MPAIAGASLGFPDPSPFMFMFMFILVLYPSIFQHCSSTFRPFSHTWQQYGNSPGSTSCIPPSDMQGEPVSRPHSQLNTFQKANNINCESIVVSMTQLFTSRHLPCSYQVRSALPREGTVPPTREEAVIAIPPP